MVEGSFEVKLPTIWTDEKTEVGTVREEKEDAGALKSCFSVAKHWCFSDVLWRRWKSAKSTENVLKTCAARSAAKHISSKRAKHLRSRALLEVEMFKKRRLFRSPFHARKQHPKRPLLDTPACRICKDAWRCMAQYSRDISFRRMLPGQDADFLKKGCVLEHQIFEWIWYDK